MVIVVKYFGIFQECARAKQMAIEAPEGATAAELYRIVSQTFPEKRKLPRVLFAINQEFAKPSQRLRDGDEFGLIPPLSGG